MGSLASQGKKARAILEDPNLTGERLLEVVNKLYENIEQEKPSEELGFSEGIYQASKALINAYVRWVLIKKVKPTQQVYSVCPGWCQTDLGGPNATDPPEKGAVTPAYLINLPFKVDEDINGKFLQNKNVIPWDYQVSY